MIFMVFYVFFRGIYIYISYMHKITLPQSCIYDIFSYPSFFTKKAAPSPFDKIKRESHLRRSTPADVTPTKKYPKV